MALESRRADPGERVRGHQPTLHAQRPRHSRLGDGLLERTSRPHDGTPDLGIPCAEAREALASRARHHRHGDGVVDLERRDHLLLYGRGWAGGGGLLDVRELEPEARPVSEALEHLGERLDPLSAQPRSHPSPGLVGLPCRTSSSTPPTPPRGEVPSPPHPPTSPTPTPSTGPSPSRAPRTTWPRTCCRSTRDRSLPSIRGRPATKSNQVH